MISEASTPFQGLFSIFLWRALPVALSFWAVPLFSFEVLPFFDMRASSPLMYFSALASTSAMLSCGFFEMENIKSFSFTPNPAMKAVIANFSSGMSTFRDSALNL